MIQTIGACAISASIGAAFGFLFAALMIGGRDNDGQ